MALYSIQDRSTQSLATTSRRHPVGDCSKSLKIQLITSTASQTFGQVPYQNQHRKPVMKTAALTLALLASCIALSSTASAPAPAPCPSGGLAEVAQAAGLTTLLQAVETAGLTETVGNKSAHFTIFAPTNQAFTTTIANLGVPNLTLEEAQNLGLLVPILENHILEEPYTESELQNMGSATALGGQELKFGSNGKITTASGNSATITMANVDVCKDIVQVIDAVLVPDVTQKTSGT
ncbi:hypothetical protein WJX73_000845 [Symbiochloris irregularis]|uniref:FAS1 domain-containing protein n=1 Tax=Symbiochloris irregularis TaxID=706552 RepID=A0AAW1PC66_9CHLO